MFLLTGFNLFIIALLIAYVFFRLFKTKGILTLVSFTLQLSTFTIVLLSLINQVQTSTQVEVFYITFGILCPCGFIAYDYISMIRKVKVKGSFDGLITVTKKVEKAVSSDIMDVAGNQDFVPEALSELALLKDDLLKGMRKKIIQAEAYYQDENYESAYEIYQGLTSLASTSSNLFFNYGNICFKKGLLNEALNCYRKVFELREQQLHNIKKSGLVHHSNDSDFLNDLRQKDYLVYFNIGVTYLNLGKPDFAMDNFKKALEQNPRFDKAKEGIGRVCIQEGRKLDAVQYFEEILVNDSQNYGACILLGKLFAELESAGQAEERFRQCIKINPKNVEAYTELGKLLLSGEKFKEAIKTYKSYIGIHEEDFNGHYHLANCYYQTKDLDNAVYEYELALKLNPKSYRSVFNLGMVYEEKQNFEKAIECYKKTILLNIEFVDAYNNLGILYSRQQRQVEALATYASGIKISLNNFRLYYNMGVVLFDLRRYEDAADAFKQAAEIDPQDTDVYYYLGASLTEMKKYDEAIKIYSRALNSSSDEGELYYNIAAVYALMKKQDIAIDNLKKAISLNSGIREQICQNSVFDYMQMNRDFVELIS